MDTLQILCTLRNVNSFVDVCASDLLPCSITKTCTVIVNADPHTKGGSQWLAAHFRPKFSYAYYFDSYGIVPFVPEILAFVTRNCTTWDRNKRQLQSLTSEVCGKYCCLFACTWIGDTLPSNSWRSSEHKQTGRWRCSRPNSGLRCLVAAGVMLSQLSIKGEYFGRFLSFLNMAVGSR